MSWPQMDINVEYATAATSTATKTTIENMEIALKPIWIYIYGYQLEPSREKRRKKDDNKKTYGCVNFLFLFDLNFFF